MNEIFHPWLPIAEAEIGIHETPGPESTQRILEYFKATVLTTSNDETPWCSAFVNWCMLKAGIQGTHSARARSWLNWGDTLKDPEEGCIVVLKRGNNPDQGHVGFLVNQKLLGGNQGNKVCIESFLNSNVLGYRWPKKK